MSKTLSSFDQEPEAEVLFSYFNEISIISQLSGAMFEKGLPFGLTNAQFSVLNWFIKVDSEATPGRLATAFQVTAGAMTNTLKKLAAKQLIKVEPDPNSGRKKRVTITEKGRNQLEQAILCTMPVFGELLQLLDSAKIEKQLPLLQEIRKTLDEMRYKK
jgi:DNA-binding MarR family transcriptional regulator|tara:strand:+ start:78 stop:554 length:477 start_codon:yes stop_codon:yes gene_type:complete